MSEVIERSVWYLLLWRLYMSMRGRFVRTLLEKRVSERMGKVIDRGMRNLFLDMRVLYRFCRTVKKI